MGPRDYFNVVIYNTKDGKPEGVQLKALTEVEVRQYFEYVKNKEFGSQPIGNGKEKVVEPDGFQIFDFSKMPKLRGKTRPIYKTTITKKAKEIGDFLTACEELGEDVTDFFNIRLEEILGTTRTTVTTPEGPISDEDDSESDEYFNLYIETPNKAYSEREIFNTFGYPVLDINEINQYIDLLKRKSWGEHTIGKYVLQVTPPSAIKIFDLSEVVQESNAYSREEIFNMVPILPDPNVTILEQFERYGADATKKLFGNDIDYLLDDLQFDIQLAQRGINAGTGEKGTFFTEGNTSGDMAAEGSLTIEGQADLTTKTKPIYPKEFQQGILDGSIEPAFKVEKIASVFANHLKNLKHENGQMIGVFGQWGRGKTYFLNKVFGLLHSGNDKKFIQVNFQAWRYQNTPSIWAYLYQTFIEKYMDVCWNERLFRIFRLNERRNGKWESWILPLLTIIFGIVWILVFNFNDKLQGLNILIKWAGGLASFLIIVFKVSYFGYFSKNPAIKILNTISKVPSFQSVLGVQAEIQKELVFLIQTWTEIDQHKRILLFIDDLDRCPEHQLINIIDSLRVMLDDEEINRLLLVLVALDEVKLIEAINGKYEKLTEKEKIPELANEYLDKLFITAIKLNPISDDERAEFIKKIAKQINPEVFKDKNPEEEQEDDDITPEGNETDEVGQNEKGDSGGEENSDQEDENNGKDGSPSEPEEQDEEPVKETEPRHNLDKTELNALTEKIKLTNEKIKLTPRQIRIVVYRYLLARNLWIVFYDNLDWKTDDAVSEIMRLSGYTKEDKNNQTKVNGSLFKICQMVMAY